jgi:hypothetical protein
LTSFGCHLLPVGPHDGIPGHQECMFISIGSRRVYYVWLCSHTGFFGLFRGKYYPCWCYWAHIGPFLGYFHSPWLLRDKTMFIWHYLILNMSTVGRERDKWGELWRFEVELWK